MNFNEYQEKAHTFAIYPGHDYIDPEDGYRIYATDIIYPALALTEEAGEVAGKIAKAERDAGGLINAHRILELKKELGDVLWQVAELATRLGLSLESIANENITKLEHRKRDGKLTGSGDSR